jgi:lactate permease
MPFLVTLAPIVLLVFLMTKRNATPSHVALPMTALLVYVLQLVYFGSCRNDPYQGEMDTLFGKG